MKNKAGQLMEFLNFSKKWKVIYSRNLNISDKIVTDDYVNRFSDRTQNFIYRGNEILLSSEWLNCPDGLLEVISKLPDIMKLLKSISNENDIAKQILQEIENDILEAHGIKVKLQ
jgi:hypothetical protein